MRFVPPRPSASLTAGVLTAAIWLALGCVAEGDDDDGPPDDRPRDPDGCLIAPSGGSGGVEGAQWFVDELLGVAGDDSPSYEILAYGPPGIETAVDPVPLTVFVSRTLPENYGGLLAILEGELKLDQLAQMSRGVVAVAVPGYYEGNLPTADDLGLNIGTEQDDEYFLRAFDVLESRFNINRARVHIFGSHGSGGWATYYAHFWGDRFATTANQAGFNPFDPWPVSWLRPVPFMAIRDPEDPFFPLREMEDSVLMFEEAGAPIERFYDYDGSAGRSRHEFVADAIYPRMSAWQSRHCLEDEWLED